MDYKKKYEKLHRFVKDLYPHMSEYCKEKVEGYIQELKESWTHMFVAAKTVKIRKQCKCPLMEEWIRKMSYTFWPLKKLLIESLQKTVVYLKQVDISICQYIQTSW